MHACYAVGMNVRAQLPAGQRDSRLWTADQFLAFYMTRPDGERWQLVDGLAMMMTPPSILHQRIVGNLERLLNDALEVARPELFAFGNIGIRIPGIADFNPQPDVVVCCADTDYSYYQEQFFLCAEVISPSNTAEMIERKLELYRTHPDNLHVITIDQDRGRVVLSSRADGWREHSLERLNDLLCLPQFGFSAPLSALYKGTPLSR